MKPKNQVCSLELAHKLEKLGVKQESLFYWTAHQRKDNPNVWPNPLEPMSQEQIDQYDGGSFNNYEYVKVVSAFTVAELGEMLPAKYIPKKYDVSSGNGYRWSNSHPRNGDSSVTEADARAKCLIYLLENKLITV